MTEPDSTNEVEVDADVQYATAQSDLPRDDVVVSWVNGVCRATNVTRAEVTIRFVDETEGQQLNESFCGKDYATNVLSFPYHASSTTSSMPSPEMLQDSHILGDIVICAPVAAVEAQAQGKTSHAHLAHLTVHGVLHLLGFDHQETVEAEEMERVERLVLSGLGITDPYIVNTKSYIHLATRP